MEKTNQKNKQGRIFLLLDEADRQFYKSFHSNRVERRLIKIK